MLLYKLLLLIGCYFMNMQASSPPHIIFIFVDDVGWNDVSFHGSVQIPTPNIDALAAGGIILNNYYSLPQCTPSRGALLTGKYPARLGLQHYALKVAEPTGLPLDVDILPQHLKRLGYATHMIGKWHLGCHKNAYLPTHRGFDSFFGSCYGVMDYYDYTSYRAPQHPYPALLGIDLRENEDVVKDVRGQYATDLFTDKATDIILKHNTSQPMFLYLAHAASHTGNSYMPFQAPPHHIARFKHINDLNRRIYAGMMSSLDDSIGNVFKVLHQRSMLENSIVVFSSDNGGDSGGFDTGVASNWPLRGNKMDLLEGGIRTTTAIWSPLFQLKSPRTSMQMMHVTDWLPTLYHAAGGSVDDLGDIDGIDMWPHLIENTPSPRQEILLNIDPIYKMAALRQRELKLLVGSFPGSENIWYTTSIQDDVYSSISSMDEWVWKNGSMIRDILIKTERWLLKEPDIWRRDAVVSCGSEISSGNYRCDPKQQACLFNITNDPCEYYNLAAQYPEIVTSMMARIEQLNETAVPPLNKPIDLRGDPRCHGFAYVSWMEEGITNDCLSLIQTD